MRRVACSESATGSIKQFVLSVGNLLVLPGMKASCARSYQAGRGRKRRRRDGLLAQSSPLLRLVRSPPWSGLAI
jgi:hypothetical protein